MSVLPETSPGQHGEAEFAHREAVKAYFDERFYLASNPALRDSGADPLDDFLIFGWKRGKNPSRSFDVNYYLKANPDVASAGINPLLHYAWVGRHEGRKPRRPLDAARYYLEASVPASSRAPSWAGASDSSIPLNTQSLEELLRDVVGRQGLILSASHDDYKVNFGGVQRLVDDEQRAFCNAGWTYFHFCPAAPLPLLAEPQDFDTFRVRLRVNGEAHGVATLGDMLNCLANIVPNMSKTECVVHHLLGFAPEHMTMLVNILSITPIFWIHDFFSICPNYALMRNDVKFCGAPPVDSQGCGVCTSGADRARQQSRIARFFESSQPVILAPSSSALELWTRRAGLPYKSAFVLPLARVVLADVAEYDDVLRHGHQKLRVAHIGHRALFKGWSVFEELAMSLSEDQRYSFYQFGHDDGRPIPGCIEYVPTQVTSDSRVAMIEAIAERRIDVVINWSVWPETFCFVVHEALAGGAFVVTNVDAGNIWPAIRRNAPGQGVCVDNESQLRELFVTGEIFRLLSGAKPMRGALISGQGTADWIVPQLPQETSPGKRNSIYMQMTLHS